MNRSVRKLNERPRTVPAKGSRKNLSDESAPSRRRVATCTLALVLGASLLVLKDSGLRVPGDAKLSSASGANQAAPGEVPQVRFTDITSAAGIDFVHENGERGEKLLPETMGGGCAFFDYDSDGDQDLLFVNSQPWSADGSAAAYPPATMALYRNDGRGRFEDVTAGSGLDVACYGMGAAVGDYDNDGRVDVFLSTFGANRLFHNEGNGAFHEVTSVAGVAGESNEWSTGCGWFDYDNDGDLDLIVTNYVKWSRKQGAAQGFRFPDGSPAYGRPQNFRGTFPYLYRNDGSGKFTDVSQQAGIQIRNPATGEPLSKSLGVTFRDFDDDGWLDVVVANDTVRNQLFRNRGNGSFEELGVLAGIAFDSNGNARGAMGIDAAHFKNDDAQGIAIGNFSNEMTALYVSRNNELQFSDEATTGQLGEHTRRKLTFGLFYVDYDLDGRLDLFAANGHLEPDIHRVQPHQHYEQSPQLFWNSGAESGAPFQPVPGEKCGADLVRPIVGRGASYADIDGDGDLDVLITATGRAPRLLRNDQELRHHWLRLKLLGSTCNRDAIGAEVEIELDSRTLRRQVMPTRSYLSQVELPLTIGIGNNQRVPSVTIRWPDGSQQVIRDIPVDRTYEIKQQVTSNATKAVEAGRSQRSPAMATNNVELLPDDRPADIAEARMSCGGYLHGGNNASVEQPGEPDTPGTPPRCHGPLCSAVPIQHHVPLSTPTRLIERDHHALAAVQACPEPAHFSHFFEPGSDTQPIDLADRVFRPPRCCETPLRSS